MKPNEKMNPMTKTIDENMGEQALRAYARRLRALHDIDYAILEAHSPKEIAETVLTHINLLLPNCDWSCVNLFDHDRKKAKVLAVYTNTVEAFGEDQEFPLEACRISQASGTPTLYYANNLNLTEDRTESETFLMEKGLRSFMSVPMLVQSRLIGALNLSSYSENIYADEFVDIAEEIGNSLSIAIENARLIEAERQRNQELLAMALVSAALRTAGTRSAIPLIVLDQILNLFRAKGALIAEYNRLENQAVIELGLGVWQKSTGEMLDQGKGALYQVILSKQPYHTNHALSNQTIQRPDLLGNIASVAFVPLIAQGLVIGALGIGRQEKITKDDIRLLSAIADMVGNAMANLVLTEDLKRSHTELTLAYDSTLEGWARALELRDHETEGHTRRVTRLTVDLARSMGITGTELDHLRRGVILHDIGKMGIPDSILLKPGKLSEDEWEIMRQHPRYAYEMLSPIQFLSQSIDIPYCHHEKWDGTGYPRQLKGEQIPLAARIFCIVDVYDALTSSGRPYREAWSEEKVQAYIQEQTGKHFDPQVVDAFFELMRKQVITKSLTFNFEQNNIQPERDVVCGL